MEHKEYFINVVGLDERDKVEVVKDFQRDKIVGPCYLFLDQATHTGFSVFDSEYRLILAGQLTMSKGENTYQYAKQLQEYITKLVKALDIQQIIYEETFLRASLATKEVLDGIKFMVKGLQDELGDKIVVDGVDNNKWKSLLAYPKKFNDGSTNNVKAQVLRHLIEFYPNLQVLEEDIMDAIGMGVAIHVKLSGPIWKYLAYNKKLGYEVQVLYDNPTVENFVDTVENKSRKIRKVYQHAMEAGGVHEYDMQETMSVDMLIKQYLSYYDCLLLLRMRPDNRYHMMMLLLSGGDVKQLQGDETYTLMLARKKRK